MPSGLFRFKTNFKTKTPLGILVGFFGERDRAMPSKLQANTTQNIKNCYTHEIIILFLKNSTEGPQFSPSITIDNLNSLILISIRLVLVSRK